MKCLQQKKNQIVLFLIVLVIGFIPIPFLESMVFIDELGTVGNVVSIVDLDWANFIGNEGFFYKYGQALLYIPALLIKSYDARFQAMLTINAVLIALIPVIVYSILNRHMRIENKSVRFGIALTIGLLPSGLLLSKYVWAESILYFTTWSTLYCMLEAYTAKTKKRKRFFSVLLSISAFYAFASHQRGIVIVIAVFLMSILIRIILKEQIVEWKSFISASIVCFDVDKVAAQNFTKLLFSTNGVQGNTVETSVKANILREIFSLDGIKIIIKECIGWFLGIFDGTYGLVLVGGIGGILFIIHFLKKIEYENKTEILIVLYGVLISLGAFCLGILFFFEAISNLYLEIEVSRADRLIYTRYLDSVVGPLCLVALWILCEKRVYVTQKLKCILLGGALSAFIISCIFILPKMNNVSVWLHTLFSVSLFVDSENLGMGFVRIADLSAYIIAFTVVVILIFTIILQLKSKKRLLMICCTIFSITYFGNVYKIVYQVNNYYSTNLKNTDKILTYIDEKVDLPEETKNLYIAEDLWRISFRYAFDTYDVLSARDGRIFDKKNMLIVSAEKKYEKSLYQNDYYEFRDIDFDESSIYIYIKGDDLNQALNAAGITTAKVKIE